MPPVQIQIVIFAVIAAVVLFQLYNVLGKKVGRQPEDDARAKPALAPAASSEASTTACAAALAAVPRTDAPDEGSALMLRGVSSTAWPIS